MFPLFVRMTPSRPTREAAPSAAAIEDMIWAAAVPQDCLEHLTVARGHDDLSVAVFVRARDLAHAGQQVDRLIRRMLGQAPPLAGWTVTECIAADLRRPIR
jgi:hypothetical protein